MSERPFAFKLNLPWWRRALLWFQPRKRREIEAWLEQSANIVWEHAGPHTAIIPFGDFYAPAAFGQTSIKPQPGETWLDAVERVTKPPKDIV